jgi:hypothetical protein
MHLRLHCDSGGELTIVAKHISKLLLQPREPETDMIFIEKKNRIIEIELRPLLGTVEERM